MLIILVRHAERETRPDRPEAEQVLTDKGRLTAIRLGEKLAERLRKEEPGVASLLTSTYARATQTAALIAPYLGLGPGQIQPVAVLQTEPDGSVVQSLPLVLKAASRGVVVVGHGPDLASLSEHLCGRSVELKKASAVAIDWDEAKQQGKLLWQLSHKD